MPQEDLDGYLLWSRSRRLERRTWHLSDHKLRGRWTDSGDEEGTAEQNIVQPTAGHIQAKHSISHRLRSKPSPERLVRASLGLAGIPLMLFRQITSCKRNSHCHLAIIHTTARVHGTSHSRKRGRRSTRVELCRLSLSHTEELCYLLGAEWEGEGGEGKGFSPRLTSTGIKYPFAL